MSGLEGLALLVITDLEQFDESRTLEVCGVVARAARCGSVALELRDRRRGARQLLALGERLAAIAREHGQAFVVNDRLDLALCLGADALHLGEASIATVRARELIGALPLVRACHRVEDVASVDADVALLSPILAPRKGNPPLGFDGLRAAKRELAASAPARRLFALGGIDAANAAECLRAGAAGVAAISGVFAGADPTRLLAALGIER